MIANNAGLTEKFTELFAAQPSYLLTSPGRMEVIGNHTDYNHGLCLAAAIEFTITAALRPSPKLMVRAFSKGSRRPIYVDLSDLKVNPREFHRSTALVRGVAAGFVARGYKIGGLEICATSSIPRGAGVSSSAAYELLLASAFNLLYNDGKIDATTLAQIAQAAEVTYFNKPCGLLDQMSVAHGGLIYLDFAQTDAPLVEQVPFYLPDYQMILINAGGSHSHLTNYYSETRSDIQKVATFFQRASLRDVPVSDFLARLDEINAKFGGRVINRALHVFNENGLVEKAKAALLAHDQTTFVECIRASGLSSLTALQNYTYPGDTAQGILTAYNLSTHLFPTGAYRVHGGGFAGTMLALLPQKLASDYQEQMGKIFGPENILPLQVRPQGPSWVKL